MSDEKPREFWLNPNPDNRGWSAGKPDEWAFPPIHAIEFSAYEAMRARAEAAEAKVASLEALAKDHEDDWKRIQDAERKLDQLRRDNEGLMSALVGLLEIGKRDLTNPKYDSYFDAAREALEKFGGEEVLSALVVSSI